MRVIFRIMLALVLVYASPVYADWQLPEGMQWQTRNGLCTPDDGDVFFCAYGPEGTNSRVAEIYFRVCGDVLESKPFLTVDLVSKNFIFEIGDGTPVQISPLARGVPHTAIDVAKFFLQVQEKRGPCAKERVI